VTSERWAQIEELFHRVAECSPQRRPALLDDACGNDFELREQVEALLAADQNARSNVQCAVRSELDAVAFSLIGKNVSHYQVLAGLGAGGMGLVYRAEDIKLGRHVAIKFLPEDSAKDPAALKRFEREARSASALEHPNICPIYEFGEHEGQPFLVMQMLEGQTLREIIAAAEPGKPPFVVTIILDIAIQIVDGLNAAHTRGIIHRDIKPANIFVTADDEVKILDFGLAKLAPAVTETMERQRSTNKRSADLFLSRTGTTMGTAAYMSPEQVRGEQLDARTDLFSFGLVLYEAATGQCAIKGDTGTELHQAVLTQSPVPPRELNPAIPARLQTIIQKCIEKDRQERYASASDLGSDLQKLKREVESRHWHWWAVAAGLAILAGLTLFFTSQSKLRLPRPELKLRQLTANAIENSVSGGMISPDGKYLAFSDTRGLHVQVIETGESQAVPLPKELEGRNFDWRCAAWAPDSTHFLGNSIPAKRNPGETAQEDISIWEVPVSSRIPRKLRGGAIAWSFSLDGSLIAFGANGGPYGPREIWLMDANGEHARKLFESGDDDTINTASWSTDGQRLVYVRDRGAEVALFSRDLKGGPPVLLERPAEIKDKRIDYGITLPDGRSIFSVAEEASIGMPNCNFWEVKNDLRTGKLVDQPRQLTNWSGFCMDPTSVTSDMKKLAFLHMSGHPTVRVADLQHNGTQISNERHFTLTESMDLPIDWTRDSQSVIFFSKRNGQGGIYKQRLDQDVATQLFTSPQDLYLCCATPVGDWLLFAAVSKSSTSPVVSGDIMRLPLAGGPAEKLFSVREVEGWGCARLPSILCVIAERSDDGKWAIVTSFDPEKGRGAEVTRIALDPLITDWTMALSADGKRVALIRRPGAPLEILSLQGKNIKTIKIPEWSNSGWINWFPDGQAVFVPVLAPEGSKLLRVDLRGSIRVVRVNAGGNFTAGVPSPDGRHIAIEATGDNKNMWMMENF
jgi:eukaryotic-like serine/threonine-protein kinase